MNGTGQLNTVVCYIRGALCPRVTCRARARLQARAWAAVADQFRLAPAAARCRRRGAGRCGAGACSPAARWYVGRCAGLLDLSAMEALTVPEIKAQLRACVPTLGPLDLNLIVASTAMDPLPVGVVARAPEPVGLLGSEQVRLGSWSWAEGGAAGAAAAGEGRRRGGGCDTARGAGRRMRPWCPGCRCLFRWQISPPPDRHRRGTLTSPARSVHHAGCVYRRGRDILGLVYRLHSRTALQRRAAGALGLQDQEEWSASSRGRKASRRACRSCCDANSRLNPDATTCFGGSCTGRLSFLPRARVPLHATKALGSGMAAGLRRAGNTETARKHEGVRH